MKKFTPVQKTLLICIDDKDKQNEFRNIFKSFNYKVIYCSSGRDAVDTCIKTIVDCLIIDFQIADIDGLQVISMIREFNHKMPIIVISSKANIEIKVMAFEIGANDFLVKPFNNLELIARIKNQLRYFDIPEAREFENGPLKIDFGGRTVFMHNKQVHLTNFEYKILLLLAENLDKTLTHDYIIDHVWGSGGEDHNGLRVFMACIRKKLGKDKHIKEIIKTVVGVGYRMDSVK